LTAYYNEIDPFAAQWLRELIKAGHIAPGEVDERSIEDVHPTDLRKFKQCHFFAGIGVWSYALRRAGWDDDRRIWTGSCPCQPFSEAGKGGGFTDDRHLWPAFFHLIQHEQPVVVVGEQVASNDGLAWLDLVFDDLEGARYTVGAVDTCAAGYGAPHIRQRLYWMANAQHDGLAAGTVAGSVGTGEVEGRLLESERRGAPDELVDSQSVGRREGQREPNRQQGRLDAAVVGGIGVLADSDSGGLDGRRTTAGQQTGIRARDERSRDISGMADTDGGHTSAEGLQRSGQHGQRTEDRGTGGMADASGGQFQEPVGGAQGRNGVAAIDAGNRPARPTNGFWGNADWLRCRDGLWRPVEPSTFPLVNGLAGRVGLLRGFGNAINAAQATAFIEAVKGNLT
jgi:DNA (cytosine-5)-methyltransferase 1